MLQQYHILHARTREVLQMRLIRFLAFLSDQPLHMIVILDTNLKQDIWHVVVSLMVHGMAFHLFVLVCCYFFALFKHVKNNSRTISEWCKNWKIIRMKQKYFLHTTITIQKGVWVQNSFVLLAPNIHYDVLIII